MSVSIVVVAAVAHDVVVFFFRVLYFDKYKTELFTVALARDPAYTRIFYAAT